MTELNCDTCKAKICNLEEVTEGTTEYAQGISLCYDCTSDRDREYLDNCNSIAILKEWEFYFEDSQLKDLAVSVKDK